MHSKIDQTTAALAALTAVFVRTVGEGDPGFHARFERQLEEVSVQLAEDPNAVGAMETLSWVREILRGPLRTPVKALPGADLNLLLNALNRQHLRARQRN
jgi:hypothetical protein